MKRIFNMKLEGKILLVELTLNNTLVLPEIMKKKKRNERRGIWINYCLKRREEKETYNSIISDRHRFS